MTFQICRNAAGRNCGCLRTFVACCALPQVRRRLILALMSGEASREGPEPSTGEWPVFATTHWSLVLGEEQSAAGKGDVFAHLKDYLWGEASGTGYVEVAARLGLTEGALKVAVHRLRQRYRELLREEVAQTVAAVHEVDEELRYLVSVIRG